MDSERTESLSVDISRAMSRRLKKACAKLRITPDDIFEIGFNAIFPPEAPRKTPRLKKRAAR